MKTRVEDIAVGARIKVQITSAVDGVSWEYVASFWLCEEGARRLKQVCELVEMQNTEEEGL